MTFEVVPGRVWGIDSGLGHERCTAVYLIRTADGDVLVDCAAASCFKRVMEGLFELDVTDLIAICPTHVHLDHAGGCGHLAAAFSDATIYAHLRAARHLADPTQLVAGAKEVWGEVRFNRLYGTTVPVPEERIVVLNDGESRLGLQFFDAPGHARHHYFVWDEEGDVVFAGDAFGLAYEGGISFPSSSPVQFDPTAATKTVFNIMALAPSQVAITHFGAYSDVPKRSRNMVDLLSEFALLALQLQDHPNRREEIKKALRDLHPPNENRVRYETDIEINAAGLDHWLTTLPREELAR